MIDLGRAHIPPARVRRGLWILTPLGWFPVDHEHDDGRVCIPAAAIALPAGVAPPAGAVYFCWLPRNVYARACLN